MDKWVIIGRVLAAVLQWALRDEDDDGIPDVFERFLPEEGGTDA